MPLAGFKLTIPVFKRAKTFHALDRAATVTGNLSYYNRFKNRSDLVTLQESDTIIPCEISR
jgi:hypothetical protein